MTDRFGTTIGIVVAPPIVVKKDKGIVTGTLNAWKGCCVAGTIVKMNLKQDHLLGIAMRTAATIQHLQPMLEIIVLVIVFKLDCNQILLSRLQDYYAPFYCHMPCYLSITELCIQ